MTHLERWWQSRRRRRRVFDWAVECPELKLPPETYVRLLTSSRHPLRGVEGV